MNSQALRDLAGGVELQNIAANLGSLPARGLPILVCLLLSFFLWVLSPLVCPFPLVVPDPPPNVHSQMAVSRASGSRPAASASLKIIDNASVETAAHTCSRYSRSVAASPLAFSTREWREKTSNAGPRHAKMASAPTTPSSASRGIHS